MPEKNKLNLENIDEQYSSGRFYSAKYFFKNIRKSVSEFFASRSFHKRVKQNVDSVNKKFEDKEKRKNVIRKKIKEISMNAYKKKRRERINYKLSNHLQRAGFSIDSTVAKRKLFSLAVLLNLLFSVYVIFFFSTNYHYTLYYALVNMFIIWTIVFAAIVVTIFLAFHLVLDLRIFHRKQSVEYVLADFLQLTSANIRAGMPIDQSLWYAVRPRFGILAKEIEIVAKETLSGKDLSEALIDFTDKYKSVLLKRSFNLLIEGMEAGGEVGDILTKISIDINEANILKKQMSANVTTYAIFISFATVGAAPFLFALSSQLLHIMTSLTASIDVPSTSMISLSGVGITQGDFRIYSYLSLTISAMFSAMIVSVIKKGTIKEGVGTIFKFVVISLGLFYFANWAFSIVFSSII